MVSLDELRPLGQVCIRTLLIQQEPSKPSRSFTGRNRFIRAANDRRDFRNRDDQAEEISSLLISFTLETVTELASERALAFDKLQRPGWVTTCRR